MEKSGAVYIINVWYFKYMKVEGMFPLRDQTREALIQWKQHGDPSALETVTTAYGFTDVAKALKNIQGMAEDELAFDAYVAVLPVLLEQIASSAAPDMALINWERFAHATIDSHVLFNLIHTNVNVMRFLNRLFSASYFLSDILVRNPEYFNWLIESNYLSKARDVSELVEEFTASMRIFKSPERRHSVLCRLRRRELLRIGARDLLQLVSVEEITHELSDLAESIIRLAFKEAWNSCVEMYGDPLIDTGNGEKTCAFSIIAMGKLGGGELNFSSDIDLIFVYEDEGETTGINQQEKKVQKISNHVFFTYLTRNLLKFLSDYTDEGRLYRCDIRLRPEGESGPLVRSFESYANYFYAQARSWECIAYLKARHIAGDDILGSAFRDLTERFIFYPRDPAAFRRDIIALKERIDYQVREAGLLYRDVKRGYGGIREIEFLISTMQLLHARQYQQLITVSTYQAIRALNTAGLIKNAEAAFLHTAYTFLRSVEHRLQIVWEKQTHILPDQPEELDMLAQRMGYSGISAGDLFMQEITRICKRIHSMFISYLQSPAGIAVSEDESEMLTILDSRCPADRAFAVLKKFRFAEPRSVTSCQQLFHGTREIYLSATAQKIFEILFPKILKRCKTTPSPDAAIRNLVNFIGATKAAASFYEIAAAQPSLLNALISIFGTSDYISQVLISHPEYFEPLISGLEESSRTLLDSPAEAYNVFFSSQSAEDKIDTLRRFRWFWTLIIAANDIIKNIDIHTVMRSLTYLAEYVLDRMLDIVSRNLQERYGKPVQSDTNEPAQLLLFAFGGFGGFEINYLSDLDIVFVMAGDGSTNGKESIENKLFFTRIAENLASQISQLTPSGRLYTIDARLRPEGSSAELVCAIERFLGYYQDRAQLWELQSFLKVRAVGHNEKDARAVQKKVQEIIKARLKDLSPEAIQQHILDMRERLEKSVEKLPSWAAGNFKRGKGGLMDIEFLVQYLQLRHATTHPELFISNTYDALQALKRRGIINPENANKLCRHYTFLRRLESRQRLLQSKGEDLFPANPEKLESLAYAMEFYENPVISLQEAYETTIRENRDLFKSMLHDTSE